jgi:predicted nuclease with TOPRIM domain
MDAQDASKTDYQEQGPKKGIVIIVITILLGTNGLLLWQFFEKKNSLDAANQTILSTTAEKDALQNQLNQVRAEYEKIKQDNAGLQSQLAERDEEIKAKMAEIQRLIALGGPAQIARAKAELAKLKEMNQVYIGQIDSLNKVNAQLQAENMNLNSNLQEERSRSQNLASENNRLSSKVAAGSVLKAMNVTTEGVRFRSTGKEVLTNKAKQVQKIRTRFTLAENRVIDRGPVDLYIRVIGPDGAVMSASTETFQANGNDLNFTLKQTVEYTNSDTPVEVSWAKGSEFPKGKYTVEIYHGGSVIGKSGIDLK